MVGKHLRGVMGRAILVLAMVLGTTPVMAASWAPRKPFARGVPPVQSDLYDPFWSLIGPEYNNPYLFNGFLNRQLAYPPSPLSRGYEAQTAPPRERYVLPGPHGMPPYQDYGHYYPEYYPYAYAYPQYGYPPYGYMSYGYWRR